LRKVTIIFALIAAILTPGITFAEDISGKVGVGANWFFYFPDDTDFEGEDVSSEATGEAANLHLSYCLPLPSELVNVNVVLDWEYISREIVFDKDLGDVSSNLGDLSMMPLMISAQARFAGLGMVVPYVGFGVGVCVNTFDKGQFASDVEDYLKAQTGLDSDVSVDVDPSFAFKIPVGVDVFITDNIALNVEAKYFYTKPNFNIDYDVSSPTIPSSSEDDEIDQSSFAFGAGVSFYF